MTTVGCAVATLQRQRDQPRASPSPCGGRQRHLNGDSNNDVFSLTLADLATVTYTLTDVQLTQPSKVMGPTLQEMGSWAGDLLQCRTTRRRPDDGACVRRLAVCGGATSCGSTATWPAAWNVRTTGVCGGEHVGGCRPRACNYDPAAVIDDGSCVLGGEDLTVTILTDEYPGETTWTVTDINGTVVASSNCDGSNRCVWALDVTVTMYDSFGGHLL